MPKPFTYFLTTWFFVNKVLKNYNPQQRHPYSLISSNNTKEKAEWRNKTTGRNELVYAQGPQFRRPRPINSNLTFPLSRLTPATDERGLECHRRTSDVRCQSCIMPCSLIGKRVSVIYKRKFASAKFCVCPKTLFSHNWNMCNKQI